TAIKLGLVGSPKTIVGFSEWMSVCARGIPSDDPKNRNFSPSFPGLAPSIGFGCSFFTDPSWVSEIADSEVSGVIGKPGAIIGLAELFHRRIHALYELTSSKPDVVLVLPSDPVRK